MSLRYHAPSIESLFQRITAAGFTAEMRPDTYPPSIVVGKGETSIRVQSDYEGGYSAVKRFRLKAFFNDYQCHTKNFYVRSEALVDPEETNAYREHWDYRLECPQELWNAFLPKLKAAMEARVFDVAKSEARQESRLKSDADYSRRSEWLSQNTPNFSTDGHHGLRFGVYDKFEAMQARIKAAHDILFPTPPER